jgi:glycolate oxidase FAD binding subunit
VSLLVPRTPAEVADAIRWALAAGEPVEIAGHGTKRALGRPVQAPHRLDLSSLAGVVSYEPAELVLTVQAGTPMQEIEALLASHSQCLAFEPPDLAPLLAPVNQAEPTHAAPSGVAGRSDAVWRGTVGGVVSAGLAGPRRFRAGAARDHVLGVAAVSGRGEPFVAGGKVVKNVTGYDLPKLLTGAFGTLAALTELTLKVLPAPQDVRTVLIGGLDAAAAVDLFTRVLQKPFDVTGAAHLPIGIAAPGKSADVPATALRLEGFTPSVEFRLKSLCDFVEHAKDVTLLDAEQQPFVTDTADPGATIWRISTPPAHGARVLERIERSVPGVRAFLDWGGGLMWLHVPGAGVQEYRQLAAHIREPLAELGGHATLIRASEAIREQIEVFHPQADALAQLSRRVKAQFDPTGVLNPGRMYAGV